MRACINNFCAIVARKFQKQLENGPFLYLALQLRRAVYRLVAQAHASTEIV
jgi:hypothetical protein